MKKKMKTGYDSIWTDLMFIAPQFLLFFIFTLLPYFISIPISFTDMLNFLDTEIDFIGFANFFSIFQEPLGPVIWPSVGRTAIFTLLNFCMIFLYGMPLALLMYEISSRIQRAFFIVVFLPFIISGVAGGMFLDLLFAKDTGSLNLILQEWGVLSEPIDIRNPAAARFGMPFLVGWRFAGFNMAIFLGGLLTIPRETIEASIIDGASYLQRLFHVYFPQMIPSLVIASVFCFVGSFGVFDEPVGFGALYANDSARFLSIELYKFGFDDHPVGTIAQGMALSLTVYTPLLIIALYVISLQKKLRYD